MTLRLVFAATKGELGQAIERIIEPIAHAATVAITGAADFTKLEGNREIASAGFSARWRNTFKVQIYPRSGESVRAAFLAWHKIPYAGIFERGSGISPTIRGRPLLWLPASGLPPRIGGRRLTPRVFVQAIGPLHSAMSPSGKPMLVARAKGRGRRGKISLGALQAGRGGGPGTREVPVFFAAGSVHLRKRFNLSLIFSRAAASIPDRYNAAVE